MHDLYCTNPDEMNCKILADEVRYYKEDAKGVSKVCKIMEEILDEGRMEGRMEGRKEQTMEIVSNMAKQGLTVDCIAAVVNQSVPTVESWIKESGVSARR